jgi:hypothetical protein
VTAAWAARVAPGEPKAVDGSLASFLPRLPILPHVAGLGEWDETLKSGHNGQFAPDLVSKIGVGGQFDGPLHVTTRSRIPARPALPRSGEPDGDTPPAAPPAT